jgi:hypothetical protein
MQLAKFTSSKISALLSKDRSGKEFGEPALTYIKEKLFETKLGRSLTNEHTARPTTWGNLLELYYFESHMEIERGYTVTNETRFTHKELNQSGMPDAYILHEGCVVDNKSPYTLKSFCTFAECKSMDEVRLSHSDGEDYYWQIVSNSMILESHFEMPFTKGELIIFCPYQSELEKIRKLASETQFIEPYKVFWIANSNDEELPYLNENGAYKNRYIFNFDIPQSDKEKLREAIIKATELLKSELK